MVRIVAAVFQVILWVWFFGCITTYKIKHYILVEGTGIKSVEFFMLCLFSLGLIFNYAFHSVGKWILFAVLVFWFDVQFLCHWYYTIFGVSEKKLRGYNECFQNTVHLIPISNTRLIPDFYHIVLHFLILINIVFCIFALLG